MKILTISKRLQGELLIFLIFPILIFPSLRYGAGNSKFYTTTDAKAHTAIQRLPSAKRLNELDQTLYLSKSTFFNDTKPPHNIVGIPIAPPANIATKVRTTIIPIRVEGRDEPLQPDLIQFESLENVPPPPTAPATTRTSANLSNTSNGLTRCIPSLPSPTSYKSETVYPISDQVDGRIRHSYDVATKCRGANCSFFGSPKNGYCSKCSLVLEEQKPQQQYQQYRKLQTEI